MLRRIRWGKFPLNAVTFVMEMNLRFNSGIILACYCGSLLSVVFQGPTSTHLNLILSTGLLLHMASKTASADVVKMFIWAERITLAAFAISAYLIIRK